MKIEIRRDCVVVDGVKNETRKILGYTRLDSRVNPSYINFRQHYLRGEAEIAIINRSGRNIDIMGVNDCDVILKTGEEVKVHYGSVEKLSHHKI